MSNKNSDMTYITIQCGGLTRGNIICTGLFSLCGSVNDGVALQFSDSPYGFVARFADIEAVYLAAKEYRQKHAEKIKEAIRKYRTDCVG